MFVTKTVPKGRDIQVTCMDIFHRLEAVDGGMSIADEPEYGLSSPLMPARERRGLSGARTVLMTGGTDSERAWLASCRIARHARSRSSSSGESVASSTAIWPPALPGPECGSRCRCIRRSVPSPESDRSSRHRAAASVCPGDAGCRRMVCRSHGAAHSRGCRTYARPCAEADRRSRVYAGLDPGCVPDPTEWLSDVQHSAVMCFERDPERAAAELRRVVRRDGATCRQVDS